MKNLRFVLALIAIMVIGLAALLPSNSVSASDCPSGYHAVWRLKTPAELEKSPGDLWTWDCFPNPTETPAKTDEPSVTPSATPTATNTVEPSATPTKTEEPTVSPTPSATPECGGDGQSPDCTPSPTPSKTPTASPTPCPKGCVVIDPQPLQCRTELGAPIDKLFDGKRELHQGSDWMQQMDGAKITLTVYNGHLRNSLLQVSLLPTKEFPEGEKLEIQMVAGRNTVATNENGTLVQDNCYRITHQNQSGENGGNVYWTQADVSVSELCVNKPD